MREPIKIGIDIHSSVWSPRQFIEPVKDCHNDPIVPRKRMLGVRGRINVFGREIIPLNNFDPEDSRVIANCAGDVVRDQHLMHIPDNYYEYDVYLSVLAGGHGCGDVLERDPEKVLDDLNWKLQARIFVRDSNDKYREIYPGYCHAHPDWMELREYYDPLDGTLLDVELVPPGYPIVHNFEPDLEAFYNDWLDRPLPTA